MQQDQPTREISAAIERLRTHGAREISRQLAEQADGLKRMISLRSNAKLRARLDGSDIMQEIYIEAVGRLERYLENPRIPPRVWLRKLSRQVLARQHRHHFGTAKRSLNNESTLAPSPHVDVDSMSFGFVDSVLSPGSYAARAEIRGEVQRLLKELDPLEREILCLKKIEGLTLMEIAAEMDVSVSTVKRRLFRAIDHFRRLSAFLER